MKGEKNLNCSFFYIPAKIGNYALMEIFVEIIGIEYLKIIKRNEKKEIQKRNSNAGIFTCLSGDVHSKNFRSEVKNVVISPDKISFSWSNNKDDCWTIERNDFNKEAFDSFWTILQ